MRQDGAVPKARAMRTPVPIMAALLALGGCGDSDPIHRAAMTPTVRLAAVPGRPAAGYFELRIEGDRGALVSVTSLQAGRIEMHETMSAGSMTSMRPIARIAVRDGDRLSFAPGGRHLMLFECRNGGSAGRADHAALHFERGPKCARRSGHFRRRRGPLGRRTQNVASPQAC